MTMTEAMDLPAGQLMDYIAVGQIQSGQAERVLSEEEEEAEFRGLFMMG